MATRVEYNRVILHNIQTREFCQEAVWDDSNTDQLYHRFSIAVVGHCHGLDNEVPTYILPESVATNDATLNEIVIRQRLMEPRCHFKMLVGAIDDQDPGALENEKTLLEAFPFIASSKGFPPNSDANNGPKPQHVDVQQIVGTKLYRVEFQIEIALVICVKATNKSGVLSNRWSISEEIDANHFGVRVIQGRLRVANGALNPNSYRHWVMPDLPRSYRREFISMLVTPDGLNLDYTIVDRQIWHAPPEPCTDWEMMHAVSTSDGVNVIEEVAVKLSCNIGTNKKLLVSRAVTLIDSRLHVIGRQGTGEFWITNAAIVDQVHANFIEARMTIQRAAKSDTWGILGKAVGATMEKERGWQRVGRYIVRPPNYYGTGSAVSSLLCYLQTPCNDRHMMPTATPVKQKKQKSKETGSDPEIEIAEGDSLPVQSAKFSLFHTAAMYTHYEVNSEYVVNHLILQLPVAGEPKKSTGSGSGGKKVKPRSTSAFIKLTNGNGIAKRIITVAGERIGQYPQMPAATDYEDVTGPAVILHHEFSPSAPRRTADGSKQIRRIEAIYTYGLTRPHETTEKLRVGVMPWDLTLLSIQDTAVPAATFISPASSSAIA